MAHLKEFWTLLFFGCFGTVFINGNFIAPENNTSGGLATEVATVDIRSNGDPVGSQLTSISLSSTISTVTKKVGPEQDGVLVYRFNLTETNRFHAKDVTKFICGSKQLCDETRHSTAHHCSLECDPCHCDDMCHFYGDCCPDLLFEDSPDTPSTPSPYVSCSEEYLPRIKWDTFPNIYLVSSCPVNASAATIKKCESPRNVNRKQATAVSSLISQITYRNIFCAQCHGVTDVEDWRYRLTCDQSEGFRGAKSKAEWWRMVIRDGSCRFQAVSPDGVVPRQCFPAQVEGCLNDTGNELVDPVFRDLCESFIGTVDYSEQVMATEKITKYKNIFCAICNGVKLDTTTTCKESEKAFRPRENLPGPLNVLLNFNLFPENTKESETDDTHCGSKEAFDPFSMICREISCSVRRILKNGTCEDASRPLRNKGFLVRTILRPANPADNIPYGTFLRQYRDKLKVSLKDICPAVIKSMEISFFRSLSTPSANQAPQLVRVEAEIISVCNHSLGEVENILLDFLRQDFPYYNAGSSILLTSNPYLCRQSYDVPSPYALDRTQYFTGVESIHNCSDCVKRVSFEPIELQCPVVEYVGYSNFTFDSENHSVRFGEYSFFLNQNEFSSCGDVLRICVETLANISKVILGDQIDSTEPKDKILSIVSLVCISLSLGGLVLTFLVYSVVQKLRTLPGKNSMALMVHLFCAQLFFLTTSNRNTNAVLCQVFGVVIHYFWMASFTWMLISAYYMHTVFTSIRAYTGTSSNDTKRLAVYSLIGVIVPVLIIASCVTTHLVQHQGVDIGYGGDICFLNNPTAIGVFFVAPLFLMLLLNAVFFTKTILAIRSVPDMEEASNKSRKHHVFVYIKLSLLFGFTWIFGIVADIFQSDVFWYVFNVLTGSQGLMIFLAYCANQRTLRLLRESIGGVYKSSRSSTFRTKTESTGAKDDHK